MIRLILYFGKRPEETKDQRSTMLHVAVVVELAQEGVEFVRARVLPEIKDQLLSLPSQLEIKDQTLVSI